MRTAPLAIVPSLPAAGWGLSRCCRAGHEGHRAPGQVPPPTPPTSGPGPAGAGARGSAGGGECALSQAGAGQAGIRDAASARQAPTAAPGGDNTHHNVHGTDRHGAQHMVHRKQQHTVHRAWGAAHKSQDDRGPCAKAGRPRYFLWGCHCGSPPRRIAPLGRPTP